VPATQRRRDTADTPAKGGTTVRRFDRAGLLGAPIRTRDGFLLVEGFVARPGIYRYQRADGTIVRELVPRSELHRADSLATLGRAPVTLQHPDDDVTPENVGKLGAGDVDGEVLVHDTGYVKVKLAVRRKDALDAIAGGTVELSPGYRVTVDPTPGVDPEFGEYDAIQRNRVYNHVAIVDVARGGAGCHLRADTADARLVDPLPAPPTRRADRARGVPMIRLLALMAAMLPDVRKADAEAALEKLPDEGKDMLERMAVAVEPKLAEHATLAEDKRKADQARADADKPEAKAAAAKARFDADLAFFNERTSLVAQATRLEMPAEEVAKLDNAALRKAIVLKANPEAKKDGTAEYYSVAYDFIAAAAKKADAEQPNPWLHVKPPEVRTDGEGRGGKREDGPTTPHRAWMKNVQKNFDSSRTAAQGE
jgi:hypothetical protein